MHTQIELAVKMTKCQWARDHRKNLPDTENATQFVAQLSAIDYTTFTHIFHSIESLCTDLEHRIQRKAGHGKLHSLADAVDFSAKFISSLQKDFKNYFANMIYASETLEDNTYNQLSQTRDLLEVIQKFMETVKNTVESAIHLYHGLGLFKTYCYVLTASFVLSLSIFPNLFWTMVSITFLFVFAQNKIPFKIQQILITRQSYIFIWLFFLILRCVLLFRSKKNCRDYSKVASVRKSGAFSSRMYTVLK